MNHPEVTIATEQILYSFKEAARSMAWLVHETATNKGFWDDVDVDDIRHVASLLALIASEVGEAVECLRDPVGYGENLEEELADIVIRCFDVAAGLELDIAGAIAHKAQKNIYRPHKHGKVF